MSIATFDKFLVDFEESYKYRVDVKATIHSGWYVITMYGTDSYVVNFVDAAFLSGEITFAELCDSRDNSDLEIDRLKFLLPESKFTLEHIPRFFAVSCKDQAGMNKIYITQLLFRWRLKNCV